MTSRNAVAHGLVYRHGAIGDGEFVIGETIYNISDFPDDTTSKNGFYTRKELKEICSAFASLTPKLNDFRQRLENDTRLQAALNVPISKVSQQESRIRLNAYAAPPIGST